VDWKKAISPSPSIKKTLRLELKIKLAPRARTELATLRLTAVNSVSSEVAGAELNRGKSPSSDEIGAVGFSSPFLYLFAFFHD
jgi:hypothetical protein